MRSKELLLNMKYGLITLNITTYYLKVNKMQPVFPGTGL